MLPWLMSLFTLKTIVYSGLTTLIFFSFLNSCFVELPVHLKIIWIYPPLIEFTCFLLVLKGR
jgi:hypothetical protein